MENQNHRVVLTRSGHPDGLPEAGKIQQRPRREIHLRTLKRAQRWARLIARAHLRLGISRESVALMDYDKYPIRMGVSSWIEYWTRLHSCKKEPEMIDWIERGLSPGSVFYDVGANVGAYTLVAAACWKGAVRMVAIEPSAVNFARLVRNLALNQWAGQVIPLPVALSDKTGLELFHYANLTTGGALHALGDPIDCVGRPFQPVASPWIMTFELDTLIPEMGLPPPTHLKLDVDGSEWKVLQGARKTLSGVQSLFVELERDHPDSPRIRSFLAEHRFEEVASYPYRYGDLQPEYRGISNVLFRRQSGAGSDALG